MKHKGIGSKTTKKGRREAKVTKADNPFSDRGSSGKGAMAKREKRLTGRAM